MKKIYKKEKQILDYINQYKTNYNELPLISNIANQFNITMSTVSGHLKRLKEKGYLNYDKHYNAKVFNSKSQKYERLLQENTKLQQENKNLEKQQKEFIKYLTHELNTSYTNSSRFYNFSLILSKYKEIIGDKDE